MASKEDSNRMGVCMVRNVHITVGVPASRRYIISKTADETIDDMFVRLKNTIKTENTNRDCDTCRTIVKWAEECDGEISNVISTYYKGKGNFIIDICIDFKSHEDSQKFCNGVHKKLKNAWYQAIRFLRVLIKWKNKKTIES